MTNRTDRVAAPWSRHYQCLGKGMARVSVNGLNVVVPDHPFWETFAKGWEPDTEQVYRRLVEPGSTVIDIGAWIGPTILYALSCGANKVVAVEPNPQSIHRLERMIALNPEVMAGVTLFKRAVSSRTGSIAMGNAPGEDDSSMFGIGGRDVQVPTITLETLIERDASGDIGLIKIDVEGAEALLLEDLTTLSGCKGLAVHLSIHVPFFPANTDKARFAKALGKFTIKDDRGGLLSQYDLDHRVQSTQSHPDWGTRHGNFFELVLIAD